MQNVNLKIPQELNEHLVEKLLFARNSYDLRSLANVLQGWGDGRVFYFSKTLNIPDAFQESVVKVNEKNSNKQRKHQKYWVWKANHNHTSANHENYWNHVLHHKGEHEVGLINIAGDSLDYSANWSHIKPAQRSVDDLGKHCFENVFGTLQIGIGKHDKP